MTSNFPKFPININKQSNVNIKVKRGAAYNIDCGNINLELSKSTSVNQYNQSFEYKKIKYSGSIDLSNNTGIFSNVSAGMSNLFLNIEYRSLHSRNRQNFETINLINNSIMHPEGSVFTYNNNQISFSNIFSNVNGNASPTINNLYYYINSNITDDTNSIYCNGNVGANINNLIQFYNANIIINNNNNDNGVGYILYSPNIADFNEIDPNTDLQPSGGDANPQYIENMQQLGIKLPNGNVEIVYLAYPITGYGNLIANITTNYSVDNNNYIFYDNLQLNKQAGFIFLNLSIFHYISRF
jgi:hypothetical protein